MAPFSYGKILVVLLGILTWIAAESSVSFCPMGCFCDEKAVESIPGGKGLKVQCFKTTTASQQVLFDIRLPSNTVQLDLSKYGLTEIQSDSFAGLLHLQKLDLQSNSIEKIAPGSFRTLPKLEILDLSRNSLKRIETDTFAGLALLSRLKLVDNNLRTIEDGSFDSLQALKKIEISDNSLVCDCQLKGFVKWSNQNSNLFSNFAKLKCALPISLADQSIKKLDPSSLTCSSSSSSNDLNDLLPSFKETSRFSNYANNLQLSPNNAQVVFERDSLSFHCQVDSALPNAIQWLVNDNPIEQSADGVQVTHSNFISILTFTNLEPAFKGVVACASQDGAKKEVDVLVLERDAPVCQPIALDTSRGQYKWGAAIRGSTIHQPCQKTPNNFQPAQAFLQCRKTGEWSATVNVSQCAYTSNVTDTLHKFATMNTTMNTMSTLLDSAKAFINYTTMHYKTFDNPMDVVYFSQAVKNYLPYLSQSSRVGHYMMDMIAIVLGVHPRLMSDAQSHGLACRRLLNVIDNITAVAEPAFQHRSDALALETHFLQPSNNFEGLDVTCSWYATNVNFPFSQKTFHCATGVISDVKAIGQTLASVTVPKSLVQSVDYQPISYSYGGASNMRLVFAAFINASLFPTTSESVDYKAVESIVIGANLLDSKRFFNLTDQVGVKIRLDPSRPYEEAQPVYWDQYSNGGYGSWSPDFCKTISKTQDMIYFTCSRLGYYGVRYLRSNRDPIFLAQLASRWHHPILYISGILAALLILTTFVAFVAKAPAIHMAKELKHSLPNLWLTSMALLYLYLLGIFQTDQETLCRFIGMTLHVFIMASFMWLLVGVHIIYCKVSKRTSDHDQDQNFLRATAMGGHQLYGIDNKTGKELEQRPALQKPLTRYYLFAYGIPTIIVTVTAAVSLDNYETDNICFLNTASLGPLIGALVVPCVLAITVMIGFGLSAFCVMAASPSRVKESSETKQPLSMLVDKHSSPKSVLLAHSLQFSLLLLSYFLAGFQIYGFFRIPINSRTNNLMNLMLCIVASISFVCYGAYLLCNYLIFREEIIGRRCIEPKKTRRKSDVGSITVDQDDMTSNLVEICPRPLPAPITSTLERQLNYPSTYGGPQSSLNSRIKDVNLARDAEIEPAYHAAGVGGIFAVPPNSEIGYPNDVYPSLFGPSSKVNNLNIHPGIADKQPKTSSPANSHIPQVQDLTVSPLLATEPYSVVPLQYNNAKMPPPPTLPAEMSLASVNTGLDYTESSTIRCGAMENMATFDLGPASSASLIGVGTPKKLLNLGQSASSSLPRSLRNGHSRPRRVPEDAIETQSKFSVGSSRSGHSKASGRRSRHKKPNRRRSRQQINEKTKEPIPKEPLYNNVMNEDNYNGDEDHYDTLDRQRRNLPLPEELPSVIHEGDDEEDGIIDVDEGLDDGGREQPADLDELEPVSSGSTSQLASLNDLPKRETSV